MKLYKLKVNGKVFEVELEEVSEKSGTIVSENKTDVKPTASADAVTVNAPMQGSIWKVMVSVGDVVKATDCVAILEAMKLENEIYAGVDGVVEAIFVETGQSVNSNEALLTIK